jgi:hypothetical protein
MRARSVTLASLTLLACTGPNDKPPGHVLAHETHLNQYATCGALETDLKDMLIREAWADIDQAEYWRTHGGPFQTDGAAGGGGGGSGSGGTRQEGVDYSGTNNQVHGVDEADGVKTDGYHVYLINGNRLHIFGTPNFGDLVPESVTQLEGHPRDMLIDATSNRAVVFSMIEVQYLPDGHPLKQALGYVDDDGIWWWREQLVTKITVLDITDRTKPALVREVFLEGWYDTARKVDTSVRISAYTDITRPEVDDWGNVFYKQGASAAKTFVAERVGSLGLDDLIPMMYTRTPDGQFVTNSLSTASCQSFFRPSDSHARGFSSIISFDLLGNDVFWNATHVVSNYPTFYESGNMIVLTEPAHSWWWFWWYPDDPDQLNVHAFDASVPGQTSYIASGRVDGWLWNRFAIDEYQGAIRLATTNYFWDRWWADDGHAPPVQNDVWVLANDGQKLARVGHLGDITPGEQITSTRFLGNRGYLSTFHYTDPLVALDLSDPTNPRLDGTLVVPGASSYMQGLGDHDLMSIGYVEGTSQNGWVWQTMISTYDVSNPSQPKLAASAPLACDSNWSWSAAMWDSHAFMYWQPKQLLALPLSNYQSDGAGYWHYLSRLDVMSVDSTTGAISYYGTIDHTPYYEADRNSWWVNTDVRRSIFMGDYIYAISDKAVSVHRTSDLGKVTDGLLPGYQDNDWWWWW